MSMIEVSKEDFYKSFEKIEGVSTGCPSTYKQWNVTYRGNVIAKAVQQEDSSDRFYIQVNE